jgi:DNA polymerase sigma
MDKYVESTLLNFYGPSEERQRKRLFIMNMTKALIREVFLPYDVKVVEYGSFPLKVFLDESDIDLTVLLPKEYPSNSILQMIKQYLEYHPMMYGLEAS